MDYVADIENKIAQYYNAPYAVYTLSCTQSIDFCITYTALSNTTCPQRTNLNVPLLLMKRSVAFSFEDNHWEKYYNLGNSNIIDAAVYWQQNGYIPGSLMCLSFQNRKHISAGGGGMILVDDLTAYNTLRQLRDNHLTTLSSNTVNFYHDKAAYISLIFDEVKDITPKIVTYEKYNDVTETVIKKGHIYLAGLDNSAY